MDLILDSMSYLKELLGYEHCDEFKEKELNLLYNNWLFLHDNADKIKDKVNVNRINILYSEYYWCTNFIKLYSAIYGSNAGYEQQQYKLLENISNFEEDIDWDIIKK